MTFWMLLIAILGGFIAGVALCAVFCSKDRRDCETCDALKTCQDDCKALSERLATSQHSCAQLKGANNRLLGKIWYNSNVGIAR